MVTRETGDVLSFPFLSRDYTTTISILRFARNLRNFIAGQDAAAYVSFVPEIKCEPATSRIHLSLVLFIQIIIKNIVKRPIPFFVVVNFKIHK